MKLLKLPLFAEFLGDGIVMVYIMPTKDLLVPHELDFPLALEYGWNMPNPIPDLSWSERGISATLSFGTIPFKTFVPWKSVVAMSPQGAEAVVRWFWRPDTNEPALQNMLNDMAASHATPRPTLTIETDKESSLNASQPSKPRLSIVKEGGMMGPKR